MGVKTNTELVAFVKQCLGRPYWMGTFGNICTAQLLKYNKERLPQYYTANDFESQFGQRACDCIGLVKFALWADSPDSNPKYNVSQDYSADSMRYACKTKGAISTIPETPGVLVFAPGHVGVYIGNGHVVEARGHAYGIVETKLSERPWQWWGKCPLISYEEGAGSSGSVVAIQEKLNIAAIKKFQGWLNTYYDGRLTVDGAYGPLTQSAALRALQKSTNEIYKTNLKVDGEWGPKTAAAIVPLKSKMRGDRVCVLQGMLYCYGCSPMGFDGLFGLGTSGAVKKFQTIHKLTVDGVAGVKVFEAMFSDSVS